MPIKKLAITSLVFGILAIVFSRGLIGLASAIIAIVIGLIALYAMKQSGDITGRKKARWGLGLGISSIIILMIMLAVEVRTQRAVYGLRESNPELFNANLEKWESKSGSVAVEETQPPEQTSPAKLQPWEENGSVANYPPPPPGFTEDVTDAFSVWQAENMAAKQLEKRTFIDNVIKFFVVISILIISILVISILLVALLRNWVSTTLVKTQEFSKSPSSSVTKVTAASSNEFVKQAKPETVINVPAKDARIYKKGHYEQKTGNMSLGRYSFNRGHGAFSTLGA